jgi:hypothetical protein
MTDRCATPPRAGIDPDLEGVFQFNASVDGHRRALEFAERILKEAEAVALESSEFTAEELLQVTKFLLPGVIARRKPSGVKAWNLALKGEKENAPIEVRQQKPGGGVNGRAGLDGRYPKWLKQHLADNPDIKKRYDDLAREMNSHAELGVADMELEDLKAAQKKALKFLSVAVSALLNDVL